MCENNYEHCLWQYQSEWFALYHTNLSHEVTLSFVWLKFSSFGWDIDMKRIRSGKTLSLEMPKATPLSFLSIGNFTWGYIFVHHMICVFAWSVLYDLSLCFLVCHNHPCFTHLSGETHMNYNALCASLISFELGNFALVLHLYLFRARRWFYFIEIDELSYFTYIILRVF